MSEKPQITTMSENGRIVIPQTVRKKLKLKAGTKFLVLGKGDMILVKRLDLPSAEEWKEALADAGQKGFMSFESQVLREAAKVGTRKS